MQYNPNLDSLRGLAAIGIILFHWNRLVPFGWIGVHVFFVLSGFLITSILLVQKQRAGGVKPYLQTFFYHRVLRLLPLYLLFIGLQTVIWLVTGQPPSFGAAAPYLYTYTLNFAWMMPGYVGIPWYSHLWTLCVEWQFYLFWPFVVWFASTAVLRRLIVALILVAPLLRFLSLLVAWNVRGLNPSDAGLFVHLCPWSQFDAFALGGILAFQDAQIFLARTPVVVATFLATVAGGLVALALAHWAYPGSLGYENSLPYHYESVWGYSLLNAAAAVLIALVIGHSRWLDLILGRWVFQYLGRISYGIYVWHAPILHYFLGWGSAYPRDGLISLSFLGLTIAVTILTAAISYHCFEIYFLRLKGKSTRVT